MPSDGTVGRVGQRGTAPGQRAAGREGSVGLFQHWPNRWLMLPPLPHLLAQNGDKDARSICQLCEGNVACFRAFS